MSAYTRQRFRCKMAYLQVLYRTRHWKWFVFIFGSNINLLFKKIWITRPSIPLFGQQINRVSESWGFHSFDVICGMQIFIVKCLVNPNIIAMLTTISPVSAELSVQRTPELAVISFGTWLVCYFRTFKCWFIYLWAWLIMFWAHCTSFYYLNR